MVDWSTFSPFMEHRQRHSSGNSEIAELLPQIISTTRKMRRSLLASHLLEPTSARFALLTRFLFAANFRGHGHAAAKGDAT
jgi:hypothetical protein